MIITWDPRRINLSPQNASKQLRSGKPSIVIERSGGGLGMNSLMLQPGEEKIIAEHLVQLGGVISDMLTRSAGRRVGRCGVAH